MREPIKPTSTDLLAQCPIVLLSAAHVRMLRDRRSDNPGAANNRLKFIGSMLSWAVERNLIRANPAREVKRLRYATDEFHAWTPDEVKQFETHHKIGSKARLALALLLYLGARRGDVVTLGRQHIRDGVIRFVPSKTKAKKMHAIEFQSCRNWHASSRRAQREILRSSSRTGAEPLRRTALALGSASAAMRPACPIAARMGCARPARPSWRNEEPPIGSSWRCTGGRARGRRPRTRLRLTGNGLQLMRPA